MIKPSPIIHSLSVILALSYPLLVMFEHRWFFLPYVSITFLIGCALWTITRLNTLVLVLTFFRLALVTTVSILLYVGITAAGDPEKVRQFIYVIVIFGFFLGLLFLDDKTIHVMPYALSGIGFISLVVFLFNPSEYQIGRLSFQDTNPIWMARLLGLAGVGGAFLFITYKGMRYVAPVLIIFAVASIVLTGSRGPLVGLVAVIVFSLVFLAKKRRVRLLLSVSYFITLGALIVWGYGLLPEMRGLSISYEDGTSRLRLDLIAFSIETILLNPRGIGVGNFLEQGFTYSHNIFVEFIVEWGWYTGGFIILVMMFSLTRVFMAGSKFDILKLLTIYEIVNASVSGDVTSPRYLYGVVVVGLLHSPKLYRVGRRRPEITGAKPISPRQNMTSSVGKPNRRCNSASLAKSSPFK